MRARQGLRHAWEVDGRSDKRAERDRRGASRSADKLILATDPDREGEAISWHVLRSAEGEEGPEEGHAGQRVVFNAITKQAVLEAMANPRADRRAAGRRLSRPPRARLSRRLHAVAGAVAQAAGRPLGRPRAVGGAAPRLRPRSRDRALQAARNTGPIEATARHASKARTFEARLDRLRRQEAREARHQGQGDSADAIKAAPSRRGDFTVASVEKKPAKRNPYAAVHHLDPAAGGLAQARLLAPRGPCRSRSGSMRASNRRRDGRPHHLYANRRRARWRPRRSTRPRR